MLLIEINYKYENGVSMRVHDIISFDNGYVVYSNEGYPCSVHKLSDFSSSEEFRLHYAKGKITGTGVDIRIISSENNLSNVYLFINSICRKVLQEHINKCNSRAVDFDINTLCCSITERLKTL